jgi:hypothetical protein
MKHKKTHGPAHEKPKFIWMELVAAGDGVPTPCAPVRGEGAGDGVGQGVAWAGLREGQRAGQGARTGEGRVKAMGEGRAKGKAPW